MQWMKSGLDGAIWKPESALRSHFFSCYDELKLSEYCLQCCRWVTALSKWTPDPGRLGCWFSTLNALWDIESVTNLKVISVPWLQVRATLTTNREILSPPSHSCAIGGVCVISCPAPSMEEVSEYLTAGAECTFLVLCHSPNTVLSVWALCWCNTETWNGFILDCNPGAEDASSFPPIWAAVTLCFRLRTLLYPPALGTSALCLLEMPSHLYQCCRKAFQTHSCL